MRLQQRKQPILADEAVGVLLASSRDDDRYAFAVQVDARRIGIADQFEVVQQPRIRHSDTEAFRKRSIEMGLPEIAPREAYMTQVRFIPVVGQRPFLGRPGGPHSGLVEVGTVRHLALQPVVEVRRRAPRPGDEGGAGLPFDCDEKQVVEVLLTTAMIEPPLPTRIVQLQGGGPA